MAISHRQTELEGYVHSPGGSEHDLALGEGEIDY